MICKRCVETGCEKCDNFYRPDGSKRTKRKITKTWCDCQHQTGVYVDQQFCKHLKLTEPGLFTCPSCGKRVDVEVITTRVTVIPLDEEVEAELGASPDG